jgi:hypothetical protein
MRKLKSFFVAAKIGHSALIYETDVPNWRDTSGFGPAPAFGRRAP